MRICHLLSMEAAPPDGQRVIPDASILACKHAIEKTPEHEHTVVLFGPQAFEDRALELGVDTTDRIACPSNDPFRAKTALSRYLRHRPFFDTLTCWSERTLALWKRAGWVNLDAVGVMLSAPTDLRDLDATPIVALDALDAEAWRARGADAHLAASPRDARVPSDDERRAWRSVLGADDDEVVLGVIAEPSGAADALWACGILVVLEHAGVRAIALVPAGARRWTRAKRVHRNMQIRSPLIRLGCPMHATIPMCDQGVCAFDDRSPRRGATALAIEHAHAAGVPVIAGPAVERLADYGSPAREHCIARSTTPTIIAGRVSAMGDARMLRRRMRTSLIERDAPHTAGLADTLSSIWAHAPARRRPMVVS